MGDYQGGFMLTWTEALETIEDAKNTMEKADLLVRKLSGLMAGRLRSADVSCYVLEKLKRELRNYNIQTQRWKD